MVGALLFLLIMFILLSDLPSITELGLAVNGVLLLLYQEKVVYCQPYYFL